MGNYVFKKFPIKTCGVSDDLSGDMLAPSWPNLVLFIFVSFTQVQLEFNLYLTGNLRSTEITNDYSPILH